MVDEGLVVEESKKPRRRRTVSSVLADAFPVAPDELIELFVQRLGVTTLSAFREVSDRQIGEAIIQGLGIYIDLLIASSEDEHKEFKGRIQKYAEDEGIDYGSFFYRRGSIGLGYAVQSIIGEDYIEDIRKALS